jgi:hypothetical protein
MPDTYYEQPYVGQPFRRVENATDGRYAEGLVSGLAVRGTFTRADGTRVNGWTAIIDTGFNSAHRISYDTRIPHGATDIWVPVPEEECEARYGPGYVRLARSHAELALRVAELETNLQNVALRVEALSNPAPIPATPAEPTATPAEPTAAPTAAPVTPTRNRRG